MFKKPLAHQSNATPLRSSARRQLLASISSQYPSLIPAEDAKEVGRIILPESVRSCTFETSGGVEGQFWLDPESGDALWMSFSVLFGRKSNGFIPTLSLLALPLPTPPLPIIELHNPIPPPILTGAPLFIAAVRHLREPWLLPDIPSGSLVAFTTSQSSFSSSDSKTVEEVRYIGIGRVVAEGGMRGAVERRRQVLDEGVDRDEGRFCDILCIIGDHLWESSSKPKLQAFQPPPPISPLSPNPNQSVVMEAGPSRPRSNSISAGTTAEREKEIVPSVDQLNINSESQPPKQQLSSSEISTLLSLSLLQSLQSPPPLPIPASLLYSAHILPNRPSYIPVGNRDDVVIAKSDWKKLGKWMKEVSKDGLIKIKETKGEVIVISIDPKHPSIENHGPHSTIAEEELKASKKAAREVLSEEGQSSGSGSGAAKGKGKEIVIEEMWKPSSTSLQFWEACRVDKTKNHPPTLIKSLLEQYAITHNLTSRAEPRYYLLDEELGRACGVKKPVPGTKMSKDEILGKLRNGVVWSVSVGGVVKKGTLSPILLTPKIRAGRKTITLIQGLETFSIPPLEFAEELKKLCAGSTTVTPLTGAAARLGLSEVMVQGNQVKVVTNVLLERGVPRKWIKEGK